MPLYNYTAIDSTGNPQTGQRTAPSEEDVAAQLQREGVTPLDITLTSKTEQPISTGLTLPGLFKAKVSKDALHMFCRQMYAVLKAGIPIGTSVSRLAETTRDKCLKEALQHILSDLNQGRSLHIAMGQCPAVFSPFFVNLVKVGENTGQLDEVFLHLSSYLELETDTTKKLKTALRYPIIVIIAMTVALFVINALVIPAFANLFASFHEKLPLPTRILLATSHFFTTYWYYLLGGIGGAIIAFKAYVKTPVGELRWAEFQLKIPVIGWLIHRILLARFARLYALVLRAGLAAVDGIELVGASTGNAYVAKKIKSIANLVSRGNSISSAIAKTGLFPPLVVQMITLGEETGSIDDLLDDVADFYQREIEYDLVRLSDAIEPMMLVLMGGLVLILALGVFLPMWNLASVALHQR